MTTSEFIEKAKAVHGDKYDYSKVEYVNKDTKVCIICPIHGEFWQRPHNHVSGKQGCPHCGKKYAREWRKNDYKPFVKSFTEKYGNGFSFPHIEEEYENNKSRITVRCNRCGYEFVRTPNYLLNDKYDKVCKNCGSKLSYEELKSLVNGSDVAPYDGLLGRDDTVTVVCPVHGEYSTRIKSILGGECKCPKCEAEKTAIKRKDEAYDKFIIRIKGRYGDSVTPFKEDYKDTMTPMRFKCNTCGHVFERTPNAFMFAKLRNPCPECSKREISAERTKTTDEFIRDAINVWGDGKFSFGKTVYTKSNEKVTITCLECGRDFDIEANSFLSGRHGCPYHNCNASIKEKEISEFLTSIGVENITNDRKVLDGHELDVYAPEYNIAIEFDGIFWHNELYKDERYHLNKTVECNRKGIRLIHIFEDEWIYKKEIWKSMIRNTFGKIDNRIFARKCDIREVDATTAGSFLDENHIQGRCGSAVRYGLYYNDELVSLMTFGKTRHFIGSSSHEYELLRFCNKLNTNVVGGASKLFKHFVDTNKPNNVVSYADRRWSNGGLYDVLGFKLYNVSDPNYYYVIDNKRHNRFNFRKSVLVEKYECPSEMSEREFCKSKGWWRIYDCGAFCYEWNGEN